MQIMKLKHFLVWFSKAIVIGYIEFAFLKLYIFVKRHLKLLNFYNFKMLTNLCSIFISKKSKLNATYLKQVAQVDIRVTNMGYSF